MILHPEVFAKAQAEIDRVVGFDRLPDFQDRSTLPYVESVVKEVYRYDSLPFHTTPHVMFYPSCEKLALPCPPRSVIPVYKDASLVVSSNRAAVPHRSMKDDQYREYDIPADTMIIPNIWSVDISVYSRYRFSWYLPHTLDWQGDDSGRADVPGTRAV